MILIYKVLYLLIFYLNQATYSFKIIDANDLPEPKLVRDLGKKTNDFAEYNIQRFKDRDYDELINDIQEKSLKNGWNGFKGGKIENNKYKNKILVKRIVPHSVAPTGLEYDHKFDTVYKPLVRVHKKKSINQFFKVKPNQYDTPKKDTKHKSLIFVSPINHKDGNTKLKYNLNDIDLLGPFESKHNLYMKRIQNNNKIIKSADLLERLNRFKHNAVKNEILELVKTIQKKVKKIKSESKRIQAYAKVINAVNLRSPAFQKSGEDNDPLAPGRGMLQEEKEKKEPVKKWIPHYPPWNYWTYKKTIHEDECPGTQVKIGNMCIWTPEH